MSTYLGFYLGNHDSAVAVAVNGQIKYRKYERFTGVKHAWAGLDFVRRTLKDWKITKIDAICYSDGNRNKLGLTTSENELVCTNFRLPGFENIPTFNIDHHYAHILSVWPIRNLSQVNIGISMDGGGDHKIVTKIIKNPCSTSPEILHQTRDTSIPRLFISLGNRANLSGDRLDFAGKLMGIFAYGTPDPLYVSTCPTPFTRTSTDLIDTVKWNSTYPITFPKQFYQFENQDYLNWLASVNLVLLNSILELFGQFCQRQDIIAYTGGLALNSVYNYELLKLYPNLVIPPHTYDGGIPLGCLEYLRIQNGDELFNKTGFPFWQDDEITETPSDETIEQVIALLQKKKLVGWVQGRGEIGPRALGNRSLLLDPSLPNGKDYVNQKVKHREFWRPYAASCLAEHAEDWFEIANSPYMLYTVPMKKGKDKSNTDWDNTPAVRHIDNTCRYQSVSSEHTYFHKLLNRFFEECDLPMLLNTSLNPMGGPIVSTKEQAIKLYNNTDMDALCIGDILMVKRSSI